MCCVMMQNNIPDTFLRSCSCFRCTGWISEIADTTLPLNTPPAAGASSAAAAAATRKLLQIQVLLLLAVLFG